MGLSRRQLILGKWRKPPGIADEAVATAGVAAVIAGRHCLAYQRSFCSTCFERCPEPDAIVMRDGAPVVQPAACTGCRICHDVCPAPVNAIRLIPRKRMTQHG